MEELRIKENENTSRKMSQLSYGENMKICHGRKIVEQNEVGSAISLVITYLKNNLPFDLLNSLRLF